MSWTLCSGLIVDDVPTEPNDKELITTVRLELTPQGGGIASTATLTDLDGPGGIDAIITDLTLATGTTYDYSVTFLNEAANPAEDITEEVREEDEEHQVFYIVENGLDATVTYGDSDGDGAPIGLVGTLTTSATASSGALRVVLRHEPVKDANGVADGDITNASGETDVEASFPTTVQ